MLRDEIYMHKLKNISPQLTQLKRANNTASLK
jgi:hypothetical protein